MMIAKPGTLKQSNHIETKVYITTKAEGGRTKPIVHGNFLHMFSKTWDTMSVVELGDKELVMPGEDAQIKAKLFKPMAVEPGQRFTLRCSGLTVGTGVITKILDPLPTAEADVLHLGKKGEKKLARAQAASQAK